MFDDNKRGAGHFSTDLSDSERTSIETYTVAYCIKGGVGPKLAKSIYKYYPSLPIIFIKRLSVNEIP